MSTLKWFVWQIQSTKDVWYWQWTGDSKMELLKTKANINAWSYYIHLDQKHEHAYRVLCLIDVSYRFWVNHSRLSGQMARTMNQTKHMSHSRKVGQFLQNALILSWLVYYHSLSLFPFVCICKMLLHCLFVSLYLFMVLHINGIAKQ